MIGATSSAQVAPHSGPSAAALDPATAHQAEPAAAQAAGPAGRVAPARAERAAVDAEDAPASAAAFADLLVQAPPPVAAPAPPAQPAASAADAGPGTPSPEHLLALLDGSRANAGATMSPPGAATAASAAIATDADQALAPSAPGLAATAMPQVAATAADAQLGADLLVANAPAAPEAAGSARDLATTTQGFALEAPLAASAASAPPAGARPLAPPTVPMPPLPMPADPAAGFDDGFGTRLVWVAEQRLGHAEIRLNPEHLGPIEVRVRLDGEQVRAEFHSAHAEVRQAIETSLPRLRDLLGQHGLQLGQADVGQGQAGGDGAAARPQASATRGDEADPGTGERQATAAATTRLRGLVDAYA